MASYYCDYYSDDGEVYPAIGFSCYLVNVTVGTRGTRENTTIEQDSTLLPPTLSEYLKPVVKGSAYCSLPFSQYRNALLWVGQAVYLHCPIPWKPNSYEFNDFINFLKSNKSRYFNVGINGEFIETSYLLWRVTH